MMRYFFYSLLVLGLFSCGSEEADTLKENVVDDVETEVTDDGAYTCPEEDMNVAIVISDGVFNTEVTAPMDIFHHTKFRCDKAMKVYTVAPHDFVVHTFEKLHIIPDYSYYSDSLPKFDVLVIPAAEHHLDSDLENDSLMTMISELGSQAKWIVSLCDGAFPLVKTGLVDGKNVTTFPSDRQALREMFSSVTVHDDYSFVVDGNVITSEGGAHSFAPALYLVEQIFGKAAAKETAKGMAMEWDLDQQNYKKF